MKKSFIIIICLLVISVFSISGILSYTVFAEEESVTEQREIPIIMYHSILKSKTGKYSVSPSNFREDINYLIDKGYESIFIKDIINFCEGNATLPKKPIIISFDDGHYNNYFYAYPILKELNFKGNLNIVGSYTNYSTTSGDIDNPNYSYVTWDEIKELQESGVFEIGNHTYNMHKFEPRFGISKKEDESEQQYKVNLTEDTMKLENLLYKNCGFRTQVFAYPFGKYSKSSNLILKELGFKAFLTCNEGINTIKRGEEDKLSHLKRINRNGNLSTYQFFSKFKIN